MAFKTIAVVGGTGSLGRVIVQALLAAGEFEIRLITRQETTTKTQIAGVTTTIADRSSTGDLTRAFHGCDVVVNVLGDHTPHQEHITVLDAAIAANVPRYVPSQWGNTPRLEALQAIPFIRSKFDITDLVEKAAREGKITFTSISGGPWIEYVMEFPTLMSVPQRTFYMHERPDFEFGICSRKMFADALVAALRKGGGTENRHLHVDLARLSQNQALELTRKALPNEEIKTVQASFEDRYKSGLEKVLAGAGDNFAFADVLSKCIYDPASNTQPAKLDNEMLGLKMATKDELLELFREASKSTQYEADAKVWLSMHTKG
ncbi:hypothetical protein BJX62DRAFT_242745 [Aspergillus germanicus]